MSRQELDKPAIVIAPHFDDETLGCGGTIMRKRALGVPVSVLFVTNGGKSHRHLMPHDQLSRIRQAESLAATSVLGVSAGAVHMLGLEEGKLSTCGDDVVDRLCELITNCRAEQIFYPYRRDGNQDHEATNALAARALRRLGRTFEVFEYPIWAWHVWPHCPAIIPGRRHLPGIIWSSLKTNIELLYRFNVASDVSQFKFCKSSALSKYKSQMTRLIDDPSWLTLADVGTGDFLTALLGDRELFARSCPGGRPK